MPLDAFGLYTPGLVAPDALTPTTYGEGSPEGVVYGSVPDKYWDTLNDILYVKDSGTNTNTGWVQGGGGGGGGGVSGLTTNRIPKASSATSLADGPVTASGNNISVAGSITTGTGGAAAGEVSLNDGAANSITLKTQTISTSFNWIFPAAGATGVLYGTFSGSDVTLSHVATQGTGNIVRAGKRVVAAADATSITPNADTTDICHQTNTQAAGTLTINAPTGTPTDGQSLLISVKSTNSHTLAWNGIFAGGTTPLPTAAGVSGGEGLDQYAVIYRAVITKWVFTGSVLDVA